MKLTNCIYAVVAIMLVLIALTFLIEVTADNTISGYFIAWANNWSTFLGTIAALLILSIVTVTYWEGRKSRLMMAKIKIDTWAYSVFNITTVLFRIWGEARDPAKEELGVLRQMIDKAIADSTEIQLLASTIGGDMPKLVNKCIEFASKMYVALYEDPFDMKGVNDYVTGILASFSDITAFKVL